MKQQEQTGNNPPGPSPEYCEGRHYGRSTARSNIRVPPRGTAPIAKGSIINTEFAIDRRYWLVACVGHSYLVIGARLDLIASRWGMCDLEFIEEVPSCLAGLGVCVEQGFYHNVVPPGGTAVREMGSGLFQSAGGNARW